MSTVNSQRLANELIGIDSCDYPIEAYARTLQFKQIYEQCDQTDIDQFENEFLSGNDELAQTYSEFQAQTNGMSLQDLIQSYQANLEKAQGYIKGVQDELRAYKQAHPSGYEHMIPQDQGDSNACGTTSLSMVLKYLGKDVSRDNLDDEIRTTNNNGTAAYDIIQAARNHGVNAEIYNESSFEEIKNHIDEGHGLIAYVDSGARGSDIKTHYIVINGYRIDPDGSKIVKITDPTGGVQYEEEYGEFVKNKWDDVNVLGIDTGIDRMLLAFSNENDLDPSRLNDLSKSYLQFQEGICGIANSLGSIEDRHYVKAFNEFWQGTWDAFNGGNDMLFHKIFGDKYDEFAQIIASGGINLGMEDIDSEELGETILTGGLNKVPDLILDGMSNLFRGHHERSFSARDILAAAKMLKNGVKPDENGILHATRGNVPGLLWGLSEDRLIVDGRYLYDPKASEHSGHIEYYDLLDQDYLNKIWNTAYNEYNFGYAHRHLGATH